MGTFKELYLGICFLDPSGGLGMSQRENKEELHKRPTTHSSRPVCAWSFRFGDMEYSSLNPKL